MKFTESAKAQLWNAISAGMSDAFNRKIGEAMSMDQYESGHIRFTESVTGDASAATVAMRKLESASPAITKVRMTPVSHGYVSTYDVDIQFNPTIAESVYSDGKSTIASLEKDGKKYVVHNDGSATEVEDPDKYVDRLNKTTGSRFKKENCDESCSIEEAVKLANDALEGTGCTICLDDDCGSRIVMKGDEELLKPTQKYLPAIGYDRDTIEGGYNPDTGDLTVDIPEYTSDLEIDLIKDFILNAVETIIDLAEQGEKGSDDEEWATAMKDAEEDPDYATKYSYAGESFVGESKAKAATLIKSVCARDFDKGKKLAERLMGKKLSEQLLIAPKTVNPINENKSAKVVISDEMAMLDSIHESAMGHAPDKQTDIHSLLEKNVK